MLHKRTYGGVVDGATVLLPCTLWMLRADSDTTRKWSRYEQSQCCFCDKGNGRRIKGASSVRSFASSRRSAWWTDREEMEMHRIRMATCKTGAGRQAHARTQRCALQKQRDRHDPGSLHHKSCTITETNDPEKSCSRWHRRVWGRVCAQEKERIWKINW